MGLLNQTEIGYALSNFFLEQPNAYLDKLSDSSSIAFLAERHIFVVSALKMKLIAISDTHGQHVENDTTFVNASVVNAQYQLVRSFQEISFKVITVILDLPK